MKSKLWLIGFLIAVAVPLTVVALWVVKVDPFFHFHKPDTSKYFYSLYNQRSQNDGISRNFDYEGLITGTSMTENFKVTEAESIFGCSFIKVPYSGGTYKELNENLKVALSHNDNLRIIIRGLDMSRFLDDKDLMRSDMGKYPTYLYNENPFDDVQYIFNRDVLFAKVYNMERNSGENGVIPGITTFDEYSNWAPYYKYGVNALFPAGVNDTDVTVEQIDLSETEKETILKNIRQNVTSLAEENPDVTFYYFFTPYSAAWWQECINRGTFNKQIQAERIVIEEILKTDNIKLFSFNNLTDITTDLNHYKDTMHYGEWINSLMLKYMKQGICLLTESNYEDYLATEEEFYWTFEYEKCFEEQEDYENDFFPVTILSEEIYGE